MDRISIPVKRYEELIALSARIGAVADVIFHADFLSKELALRTIGTEKSIQYAEKLRAEEKETKKEMHRRYDGAVDDATV